MNLNDIKKSAVLWTVLFIWIAFGSGCCRADSSSNCSSDYIIDGASNATSSSGTSMDSSNGTSSGATDGTSNGTTSGTTSTKAPRYTPEQIAHFRKRWHVEQINLFLVTVPCLLLFAFVFVCYICIYKQQRLHGWIVLAITGSLFLRFGVIFLVDLPVFYFGWSPKRSLYSLCVTYGVLHHIFFFMCYCWSLLLAFDLWRRVRTVTQLKSGSNEVVRFSAYCAFGFGVPLLNFLLAAILEWGVSDSPGLRKPSYGVRCRVAGDPYAYYIGIPTGALMVTNLVLLGSGVYYVWKAKNASAGVADAGGGAIQRNLAGLVVKVFVLMGGLIIADFAFHYTSLYESNPYLQVPIEFVCRVGYAAGFVWVFVFGGTAKDQLRKKFPNSFGKLCDVLDGGRKPERWNTAYSSSAANMTMV